MKKRRTAQRAFANLRVLISLLIVVAGFSLALLATATPPWRSAPPAKSAPLPQRYQHIDPTVLPPGFDCSKIHQLGIDIQENMRAGLIMIACGAAQGGSTPHTGALSKLVQNLLPSPLNYRGTDVDVVLPDGVYPHVTQSETYTLANPDNSSQVFIAYNDSRTTPNCYAGGSYSTDGGATFSPLLPQPFCSGHGTNFGDPVALYNKPAKTWFAIFFATGCGGDGIGAWTSTDLVNWTAGACIHNGTNNDRESGWSDNNPASPFYGRMYVSWNDFTTSCGGQGCLFVHYSTDNGLTWTNSRQLNPNGSTFIRNVEITGDLATGDVYVAGMNEGGGGFANRSNVVYRSTDGGNSWTNTYTGPAFPGPGRAVNGYFACMYPSPGSGYWTYMGWGQIAAYNHVVHYDYGQCGGANPCSSAADHGNVFYIRSTDSGVTFSAPFQLNTDTGSTAQWEPNLSVSPSGTVFATWYDERDGGTCTAGVNTPCYRMYSRKSNDNGVTWQPDAPLSDVVSPLPAQVDPSVRSSYAGDYDYGTAIATKHLTSWDDGRVAINGFQQQDVFTDSELVGPPATPTATATTTPTPTPTPTPRATPTPRSTPPPRPRPTPVPRP